MKIRSNYVSNSSSSSFIIGYDESFFGDIEKFIQTACIMDTSVRPVEQYLDYFDEDDEYREQLSKKIEETKETGKKVIFIDADYDAAFIYDLLEFINKANGGDKMVTIVRANE